MSLLEYAFLAVSTLFTLINPIGISPLFLVLTERFNDDERRAIARKGTLTGAVTLTVFALLGTYIFTLYAITLDPFRIMGGIIPQNTFHAERTRRKFAPRRYRHQPHRHSNHHRARSHYGCHGAVRTGIQSGALRHTSGFHYSGLYCDLLVSARGRSPFQTVGHDGDEGDPAHHGNYTDGDCGAVHHQRRNTRVEISHKLGDRNVEEWLSYGLPQYAVGQASLIDQQPT